MTAPRKLSRIGLYAPFALLVVAAVAWTVFWLWARGDARARLDAAADALREAGYQASWDAPAFSGYPFRLDVTVTRFKLRDPSGWAIEAPRLEAEAFLHAPNQWLIAATEGATVVRPLAGPVVVRGRLIRASLGHLTSRPPSFSFEGVDLAFQPAPGAQPFPLATAGRIEFHLRAGPDDEGGVFVTVQNAKARPESLLGQVAAGKPVTMEWNSTLSKISALQGKDWPTAVRAWVQAGGRMTLRHGALTAGDASLSADKGQLSVGTDGRLTGVLPAVLRQGPQALAHMAQSGAISPEAAGAAALVIAARQGTGDNAQASISFEAGQTTLGPVALGTAPAVYGGP